MRGRLLAVAITAASPAWAETVEIDRGVMIRPLLRVSLDEGEASYAELDVLDF